MKTEFCFVWHLSVTKHTVITWSSFLEKKNTPPTLYWKKFFDCGSEGYFVSKEMSAGEYGHRNLYGMVF